MEGDMGYLILLLLLAAPFAAFTCFVLAMVTGIVHEPTPAESAAHSYGTSWKSIPHDA